MIIGIDIRPLLANNLTGVGIYTYEVLKNLLEIDQKNQYKLFFNSARSSDQTKIEELKKFPNVKIYKFNYPNKLLNLAITFFNWPKLDKMVGGCDLFWFPNLNFWSISKNCKSIITVHDLSFKKIPWAYSKKMSFWHKVVKPGQKLKSADKIIAVSNSTKKDLVEVYGIPENKVSVIYSGVNVGRGTRDEGLIKEKYSLPHKFILYLGTLEPRKNVEGIISAFEQITDSGYSLVIGGGKGWLYRKIYKKASRSSAKDKIKFIDYVDPADRSALYQLADLFIWPSFYEGFGFPPLEAMSVGCPVITSTNSSLPEVVGDAAILVDPYNVKEITSAMNQILIDDQLRQNLINKSYQQVKKFDWQNTAKEILNIFESTI